MKSDFKQLIKPYIQLINQELENITNQQMPKLVREPIEYFFKLPGKRIRPLIALITAENFGEDYTKALPAALAVEILHNFTLVHDDVMDKDNFRRGFKTVHNQWDVGTAILSGDAMVAVAYQKLLESKSLHLEKMFNAFTDGMYIVCAGQALDKEFETEQMVPLENYMEMINQKTARLISLPFELGYLAVSKEISYLEDLYQLGNKIGLAFQIQDDLLDFIADKDKLGKDIGSDWRQRKKTYITIHYNQLVKANKSLPQNLFAIKRFEDVLDSLDKSGTFNLAKQTIKKLMDEANEICKKVGFQHKVIVEMLNFLSNRSY